VSGRGHVEKEFRDLFRQAEAQGWTITRGKHFKMKCPNTCKCMVIVGSTPSSSGMVLTLGQLKRATCWEAK
jgi:hypothetical protein